MTPRAKVLTAALLMLVVLAAVLVTIAVSGSADLVDGQGDIQKLFGD